MRIGTGAAVVLTVLLACALCGLGWFYFSTIRASIVSAFASIRVSALYDQLSAFPPPETRLITDSPLQSSTYSFGLSDGTPRYAAVFVSRIYETSASYDYIVEWYRGRFSAAALTVAAQHARLRTPHIFYAATNDSNLWTGVCMTEEQPPNGDARFVVFVDFNEVSSTEGCPDRACMVAARYCD